MRLLFISNLFPDEQEPHRGLDNATLLHAMRERAEIHTLALRPMLPWRRGQWKPREQDLPLRPRYVRTHYIPRFGHRWNHLLYARALRKPIAALRAGGSFDAVVAAWLYPDACAAARLLKGSPERFMAIAQGTDVHHYLGIRPRRRIITTELGRASAIVTRSAELARLLAEAKLPAERLHPVHNGVDSEIFHPASPDERAAIRAQMGIPPTAKVVLFVGNFLPVKNPQLLIAAHARLIQAPGMADARLVLVGGGPLESALRAQAGARETSHLVYFAGRLDAKRVAQATQAADVLALSSWNEGVPNAVLEAFASGLPVIATRVGGIVEVLHSEHLGLLFEPGDEDAFAEGLRVILERPTDTARIVAHGQSFSWRRAADAYLDLLQPTRAVD